MSEGWEEAKNWNQVIVRTPRGQRLLDLAREREILEFREVPAGTLEKLKTASLSKKKTAVKNLLLRSRNPRDLIYLDSRDPVLSPLIKGPT